MSGCSSKISGNFIAPSEKLLQSGVSGFPSKQCPLFFSAQTDFPGGTKKEQSEKKWLHVADLLLISYSGSE